MAAEWSCLCQNYQQSLVEPRSNEELFCCHVTKAPVYTESDELFWTSLYPWSGEGQGKVRLWSGGQVNIR